MFKKKDNTVKLNFDGALADIDAATIAIGINIINQSISELNNDFTGLTEQYCSKVTELINGFLMSSLGDLYNLCINTAFPNGDISYYDMLDIYYYVKDEYMRFEAEKSSAKE